MPLRRHGARRIAFRQARRLGAAGAPPPYPGLFAVQERPKSMSAAVRHVFTTRLFHAGVALAVAFQLVISLVMDGPEPGRADGLALWAHEYAGLAALALIALFWLNLTLRRVGTAPGALFPWAAPARRAALRAEALALKDALTRLRLPGHDETAALASAAHGLGLLLMSAMALSGAAWFWLGGDLLLDLHGLFGNLAWAYLLGHAGMAALHHVTGVAPLGAMWSLKRGAAR